MTMAWTKTENGYIAPATDGGSYRVWKSLRDDVPPTNPQFEWIGQRWPPAEPPGRYVRQLYKGLLKGAAMLACQEDDTRIARRARWETFMQEHDPEELESILMQVDPYAG
jgi:hypothetical protein